MSIYREQKKYVEPPTPFAGWDDEGLPALTGPHVLVSGPSGVGKSRRVLGPAIAMWEGPVVAISSKPDLVDLSLQTRLHDGGAGHTFVIDLSGEVPEDVLPTGAQKVAVDPTVLIASDDAAIDMATVLIQSGTAGAGGGTATGGGGDDFWSTLATGPLAAVLRAAGGRGMTWARQAVAQVERVGNTPDEDDKDATEAWLAQPCWETCIEILGAMESHLESQLVSTRALDGKMRDSVAITMTSAVAPWLRSTVASDDQTPFTPRMLEHDKATLFMIAPATGVAAGAAVAVVDCITARWRANQTEKVLLPRVLMAVDELCNTLPWAKLPTVVTESRAMGIHLLVAVQATAQFARRYGHEGMNELREIFPCTLLLTGAPEKEMIERAAWWAGRQEATTMSVDTRGLTSTATEVRDTVQPTQLLPHHLGEGRLLRGRAHRDAGQRYTEAGVMVRLVDISEIDGIH